jgi:hypothetical protein
LFHAAPPAVNDSGDEFCTDSQRNLENGRGRDRATALDIMNQLRYLASLIHDLADDPQGDMIELRCAIDAVQDRRRPTAVTLRRRD